MPDKDKHPTLDNFPLPAPAEEPVAEPVAKQTKARKPKPEPDLPPNLGKAIRLQTPNFSDPNRPLTCLEVDFPILPINALSKLEGNAGKPIYQMSKWWARRRSSVFRSLLLAAATQAPDDPEQAASLVWNHYYANHQKAGSFKKLRVLDMFMGGGTTLVEGSRLGMQVTGVDLNPVAWFVVKNEMAGSDPEQVKQLFEHIEAEVKPQVQPFYTTTCPRGHQGRWIDVESGQAADVDPISLSPAERRQYRWEGPEVIYTFWAKHGPCKAPNCHHRTPIFRSPIVAEKSLGTKYLDLACPSCGHQFHAELGETRMAPGTERVVLPSEHPFTEISQPVAQRLNDYQKGKAAEKRQRVAELKEMIEDEAGLHCPVCDEFAATELRRAIRFHSGQNIRIGQINKKALGILPPRNGGKKIQMFLVLHQQWLEGASGIDTKGERLGGFAGANPNTSASWYESRQTNLRLIEIRGDASSSNSEIDDEEADLSEDDSTDGDDDDAPTGDARLPDTVQLIDGTTLKLKEGTIPQRSHFTCGSCGLTQDCLDATKTFSQTTPVMSYALQCYCPTCDSDGYRYGGRFFKVVDDRDSALSAAAEREWAGRKDGDLVDWWPRSPLFESYMTHRLNGGIPNWGYTHWWKMFNPRQLLVHSQLLRCITESAESSWPLDVCEQALGAFQQYLRNQNMFAFYHVKRDCLAPAMSNANYHPKQATIEVGVFTKMGYGPWSSTATGNLGGLEWGHSPWEPYIGLDGGGSSRLPMEDTIIGGDVLCRSATDLADALPEGLDMVITDPPFGNNLFYADLADFFYAWLRIPLKRWYAGLPEADYFANERSPHAIEAVDNPVEHPDDREAHEKQRYVTAGILHVVRELAGDDAIAVGEHNPVYRPEPAADFYCQTLTACWAEAGRKLKPGGLMAFTFHHSADAPWVDVLESLFNAGFILVATYPISSDETKGAKASFGSKKIEYDIVHVCRKRLEEPETVSYARMRRWVKAEAAQLKSLLEHSHNKELPESDLLVILRGKALEFYSRHYGKVLTGDSEVLGVRDALVGINQLLDDLFAEGSGGIRPPEAADPASRLFLSLFGDRTKMSRDAIGKTLRGTGIDQGEFESRGWIKSVGTSIHVVPITERFDYFTRPGRTRKAALKTDLDQAVFLMGAAAPNSGIRVDDELKRQTFTIKPSVDAILQWYQATAPSGDVRECARLAGTILAAWRNSATSTEERQLSFYENLLREEGEEY